MIWSPRGTDYENVSLEGASKTKSIGKIICIYMECLFSQEDEIANVSK